MKKPLLIILFLITLISIVGIFDSSYLTIEKLSGRVIPCGEGYDCDTVTNSKYAYIGPIPLSVFGMLYYITVLLVTMGTIAASLRPGIAEDIQTGWRSFLKALGFGKKNALNYLKSTEFLLIIATFGAAFSIYLVSIMAFVLEAWCKYCLISAASSFGIFTLIVIFWILQNKDKKIGSPIFLKAISMNFFGWGYRTIIKPLCFRVDAEKVHNGVTQFGKLLGSMSMTRYASKLFFSFQNPKLGKTFNGVYFPNPVGLSAGFDYNADLIDILPAAGLGWHTIGTVTLEYYEGNTKPRLGRFPDSNALLVNKGLKSLGAKPIIKKLKKIQKKNGGTLSPIPICISIASTNRAFKNDKEQIDNMVQCFKLFERSRLAFELYELNISCPNVHGGEPFTTPRRLESLLKEVDKLKLKKPLYIKMPIDESEKEILALLKVIEKHNVVGLNYGNLTKDKKNKYIKPKDRKEWRNKQGNVSGKPTWNRSTNLVRLTRKHYPKKFTIIGTGGIFTGQDAQEKLDAGADLLQMITGMVYRGPQAVGEISSWLVRE